MTTCATGFAASNLEMRRGDLKPDLTIYIEDENGPVPFAGAVGVSVIASQNGTFLFKRAAVMPRDGEVVYEWQVGDTALPGTLTIEVEIMWAGNKPQTIRPPGVVKVLPDLG